MSLIQVKKYEPEQKMKNSIYNHQNCKENTTENNVGIPQNSRYMCGCGQEWEGKGEDFPKEWNRNFTVVCLALLFIEFVNSLNKVSTEDHLHFK